MSLEGRVAVITGAAGGIGAAVARGLAARGVWVVLGDRDARVHDVARETGGVALVGDAVDTAAALVDLAVARFGRLDMVHANAGVSGPLVPDLETSPEEFAEILRINLVGPWALMRAALPVMQPGGAIVATASVAGLRAGAGGLPYSASKAGLINLVQTVAQAVAGRGIRVNAVAPGLIETPMTAPLFDAARARGRVDRIGQLNPLRRAGQPDEIAQAVVFLLSDAASYVNGQVLVADGGLSCSLPLAPRPAGA
jgi:NAD(P)-dependent dehydrogenase (short-subunit alcohol dehydrogenase family)